MNSLPGYDILTNNRVDKIGGGVAIFVPSQFEYVIIEDMNLMNEIAETLFIEISDRDKRKTILGVVYKSPHSNSADFLDTLNNLLHCHSVQNKRCIIMGDFNYDLLASDTNISANDFLETFLSASFLPLISRPTRITNTSATLIDNFFSNIRSEFKAGIVISDISDHFPIFIYCSNQYQANNFPNYVPKRHVYSDVNISRLKIGYI